MPATHRYRSYSAPFPGILSFLREGETREGRRKHPSEVAAGSGYLKTNRSDYGIRA